MKIVYFMLIVGVWFGYTAKAEKYDLFSPDGALKVTVELKDRISYSVTIDGKPVMENCRLAMEIERECLGENSRLNKTERSTIDEMIKREVPLKNDLVRNHCNVLLFDFKGNYAVEF